MSKNVENYFGEFGRIISRNSLEIIEKYFGSFREFFVKFFKLSHFEKCRKLSEIFLEISRNINEIF